MSEPQTLQAPKADVELARNAKPVEVKTNPAPKHDVDELTSSIGVDLGVKGPLGVDASASAKVDARLAIDRSASGTAMSANGAPTGCNTTSTTGRSS